MSIFNFELKKLFCSRVICILFLILIVLNFALSYFLSMPDEYEIVFREVYSEYLSDMEKTDTYYEELKILALENIRNPEFSFPTTYFPGSSYDDFNLLNNVYEKAEYYNGHSESIEKIINLSNRKIDDLYAFGYSSDSYQVRMQEKMTEKYTEILNVVPEDCEYSYGYDIYLQNITVPILTVLALTFTVPFIFLNDYYCDVHPVIRAARKGGACTAWAKIFLSLGVSALITVLFCVVSFAATWASCGYSSIWMPIQSLPDFYAVPFRCSVFEYLLLHTGIRVIAFLVYTSFLAVVSSLKLSYVGCFGAGTLFSVLNVLPYTRKYEGTVPASKYLNLASMAQGCDLTGFYRTVSFFGIPVSLPVIAIFGSVLVSAIFMTAALIFYSKNFRLFRNKKKLFSILSDKCKFARRQREPKKILFANRLWQFELVKNRFLILFAVFLILLGAKCAYVYDTAGNMEHYGEALYYQYIERVQNLEPAERDRYMLGERERIDGILNKYREYTEAFEHGQMERSEYSEYIEKYYKAKNEDGVFKRVEDYVSYIDMKNAETGLDGKIIYTTGYESYFGMGADLFMCAAFIIIFARVFSVEYTESNVKGGFAQILRTAKYGRKKTFNTKMLVSAVSGALMSLIFKLISFIIVSRGYILPDMDTTLYSVEYFSNVSSSLSIREFIVLDFLLQVIFGAVFAMVLCAFSLYFKRILLYLSVTVLLFVIPELLFRTVAQRLPFISALSFTVPQVYIGKGIYSNLVLYLILIFLLYALLAAAVIMAAKRIFEGDRISKHGFSTRGV